MDPQDKSKGCVIKLRQLIASKTSVGKKLVAGSLYRAGTGDIEIAKIANKIWQATVDYFKDQKMRIVVGDMIEELIFEEEKTFVEIYGNQILTLAGTVSVKVLSPDIDKEIIQESREITKKLIELTRKEIYHHNKE